MTSCCSDAAPGARPDTDGRRKAGGGEPRRKPVFGPGLAGCLLGAALLAPLGVTFLAPFGGGALAQTLTVTLQSCATGLARPAPVLPDCRTEAPGLQIRDPEFSGQSFRAVWQTDTTVALARVNPFTGAIRTETVVEAPVRPAPIGLTGNGPEWAFSQRGTEVFFTCETETGALELCRLTQSRGGAAVSILPGSEGRALSNPSRNPDSLRPKLYWKGFAPTGPGGTLEKSGFGWREDSRTPDDVAMPEGSQIGVWLPDASGLLLQANVLVDGRVTRQLFLYDTATETAVPLLDDALSRRGAVPWAAPELGGATAVAAFVDRPEGRILETYRMDPDGVWTLWSAIPPICPGYPAGDSVEPFVFEGRSYLSLASYAGSGDETRDPGIVWIASADPDLPPEERVRRLVSSADCTADALNRRDPETLVLAPGSGARVYFVTAGLAE